MCCNAAWRVDCNFGGWPATYPPRHRVTSGTYATEAFEWGRGSRHPTPTAIPNPCDPHRKQASPCWWFRANWQYRLLGSWGLVLDARPVVLVAVGTTAVGNGMAHIRTPRIALHYQSHRPFLLERVAMVRCADFRGSRAKDGARWGCRTSHFARSGDVPLHTSPPARWTPLVVHSIPTKGPLREMAASGCWADRSGFAAAAALVAISPALGQTSATKVPAASRRRARPFVSRPKLQVHLPPLSLSVRTHPPEKPSHCTVAISLWPGRGRGLTSPERGPGTGNWNWNWESWIAAAPEDGVSACPQIAK